MTESIRYYKEADILDVCFSDEKSWKSIELPNGFVLDISKNGRITGLEIWRASKLLKDKMKDLALSSK
jgi:uncharacterized protein YuzE